jgi:predicted AAA+ superfamily ATPase
MISRAIDINQELSPGKTLLLLGPRRSGKTTLLKKLIDGTDKKYLFLNGDNLLEQELLSVPDISKIAPIVGGYDLLAIDEAQNIENIGRALKIINDTYPDLSVFATGSSSFDLHGQIGEPLVGRKRTLVLYPFWLKELCDDQSSLPPQLVWQHLRDTVLVFGQYPQSHVATNNNERTEFLRELVDSLLLKDILAFQDVKSPRILHRLLELLAHQIGSEVSLNELAGRLGIHKATVDRYLDLLEKAFIIFRLGGFSKNMRSEVTRTAKYLFYDVGVRNAIINNFNRLELRDDVGRLWENYALVERMKARSYLGSYAKQHFWRTWQQSEIDLIEDKDGELHGYEFKWSRNKRVSAPKEWIKAYPNNSHFEAIYPDDFLDFAFGDIRQAVQGNARANTTANSSSNGISPGSPKTD